MKRSNLIALSMILVAFSFNAYANNWGGYGGKRLVLNLIGTGNMYQATVPDIDGDGVDDPAMCFDVDLVNGKNKRVIGTATDCLANVEAQDNGGVALVGTSYFRIGRLGTLITRGNTSVQPVLHTTVMPGGNAATHITGASDTGNAVIDGTGIFANRSGTVRLSGIVDMSAFAGNVGDPITFDCLFIVDLNRRSH